MELAPKNAPVHFMLAQVYRKQGLMDKAKVENERYAALTGTKSAPENSVPCFARVILSRNKVIAIRAFPGVLWLLCLGSVAAWQASSRYAGIFCGRHDVQRNPVPAPGLAHIKKYLIETMGSGVALFDYDNDGRLDLFLVNGAHLSDPTPNGTFPQKTGPEKWNRLYHQKTDGTFEDVTEKAGLQGLVTAWGLRLVITTTTALRTSTSRPMAATSSITTTATVRSPMSRAGGRRR